MNVNRRFKEFRESLGMKTHAPMAIALEVERSTVSKYEKDEANIPPHVFIILELKFDLNRKWIETGEGNMFKSSKGELYTPSEVEHSAQEREPVKYSPKSIDSLMEHNGKLVNQVSELIRMQEKMVEMQLLNVKTINNLSSRENK